MQSLKPVLTSLVLFQAIVQLGLVIYAALDYGLRDDEERQLTPQTETLLDIMTSAGKSFQQEI